MLYSRYYPPGTPPTTQEDQARLAAERVPPEPTTQEDQLKAAQQKKSADESPTESPAAKVASNPEEPPIEEEEANVDEVTVEIAPGDVSEAVAARVTELVRDKTVIELREMAKEYGLDVPPRIKEETLARMIANHEQGGK